LPLILILDHLPRRSCSAFSSNSPPKSPSSTELLDFLEQLIPKTASCNRIARLSRATRPQNRLLQWNCSTFSSNSPPKSPSSTELLDFLELLAPKTAFCNRIARLSRATPIQNCLLQRYCSTFSSNSSPKPPPATELLDFLEQLIPKTAFCSRIARLSRATRPQNRLLQRNCSTFSSNSSPKPPPATELLDFLEQLVPKTVFCNGIARLSRATHPKNRLLQRNCSTFSSISRPKPPSAAELLDFLEQLVPKTAFCNGIARLSRATQTTPAQNRFPQRSDFPGTPTRLVARPPPVVR